MINDETSKMIATALLKGFDEAIEKCKPASNAKVMKDRIQAYYSNDILAYNVSLIDAIEDNKLSDIEAIIKAQDLTSKIKIDSSFYLPIGLNISLKIDHQD